MSLSYYCHVCGDNLGYIAPINISGINMTGYYPGQPYSPIDKYFKHVQYTGQQGIVSIYNTPDYDTYRQFGINAYLSGCVEVKDGFRTNLLWYAGRDIGLRYNNGIIQWPEDTVRLTFHDNAFKFHHFSQSSLNIPVGNCAHCGRVIPFA